MPLYCACHLSIWTGGFLRDNRGSRLCLSEAAVWSGEPVDSHGFACLRLAFPLSNTHLLSMAPTLAAA